MITIERLGKSFNSRWIFRDVSLHVAAQESFVLIGPSGSGKSVLLKILAGLLSADEGRFQLKSENLGMLFQKNALFDSLTVEENLLFPLKEKNGIIGKKAKTRSDYFLKQVGLENSGHLYPHEISGGMQKRLGIARSLVVQPEIILYDEPTAGLDPITSRTIAELIRRLRDEEHNTLITVTNDIHRAYQLGDRIGLLAQGTLLEGGTPAQVRSTQDPTLRQFIYGLTQGPLTSGLG